MSDFQSDPGKWGIAMYFTAVFLAIGLLFAITAVPGNSAEIFPNPSAKELVEGFQWVLQDPSKCNL